MYDPGKTNPAEIQTAIKECGFHCAGESLPRHICEQPLTLDRADGGPRDQIFPEIDRPRRVHIAAGLLFLIGVLVIAMGIYFVAIRPALLREDVRFVGTDQAALEVAAPVLNEWLRLVFIVLGGYAFTTGLLIAHIGGAAFRSNREAPIYLITFAGLTSIGLMVAVNFKIGSDFRWALAALGALWTISYSRICQQDQR